MPAPNSLLIVTAPADGSPLEQFEDLEAILLGKASPGVPATGTKLGEAQRIEFPEFKTGTLSSLLTLSEAMARYDLQITGTLGKVVETIKMLTSPPANPTSPPTKAALDRVSPLAEHLVMDDGRPYLDYIFGAQGKGWEWNRSKYRTDSRSLTEIVDGLVKEAAGIETAQKNKATAYALVKGQYTVAARKHTGNLSVRSMAEVVSAEDFAGTQDSEYLETLLIAVPKNLVKQWESSYERLASMVVPRSSTKLAVDDEYTLFGVSLFRKVHDEFTQKCREHKFVVRDFTYDEQAIEKAKTDLVALEAEEKELWSDLVRLSQINFSEAFAVLMHLKVVRAFVESVLRYGLPASYFAVVIKPEHKQATKVLNTLSSHLIGTLSPSARKVKKVAKSTDDDGVVGEYAGVLEGEYHDFVVFEVEKVE